MDGFLLWEALPYAALLTFVLGSVWRFRHDRFDDPRTRLYHTTVMSWGSPMFHVGIVLVLIGHAGGLLLPKAWTEAVGISERAYHFLAVSTGTFAGLLTLAGLVMLIARRLLVGPAVAGTTRNDKAMYALLAVTIATGLLATLRANVLGSGYDHRASVSPWLRSVLLFRPRGELMVGVPLDFQVHVLAAFALLALWLFTRLVHAFRAPLALLARTVARARR